MENDNVLRGTINEYIKLLSKWNEKINLVSNNDLQHLETRHINDSLQLTNYISSNQKLLDIGSGAGFPGLMLSYAGIKEVTLVESNYKKANFLQTASKLSTNKIKIIHNKIEKIPHQEYDIVTCRGFAEINKIFSLTENIHHSKLKFILLKGKNYQEELNNALCIWNFKYIIHPSLTSLDGYILEISDLNKNEK